MGLEFLIQKAEAKGTPYIDPIYVKFRYFRTLDVKIKGPTEAQKMKYNRNYLEYVS